MIVFLATLAVIALSVTIPAALAWALIHGAERINRGVSK